MKIYSQSKQSLEQIIDDLTAQLPQIQAKQKELAKEHIRNALKCVELH